MHISKNLPAALGHTLNVEAIGNSYNKLNISEKIHKISNSHFNFSGGFCQRTVNNSDINIIKNQRGLAPSLFKLTSAGKSSLSHPTEKTCRSATRFQGLVFNPDLKIKPNIAGSAPALTKVADEQPQPSTILNQHGTPFQGIFSRFKPQIIRNMPGSAPALSKLPGQQPQSSKTLNQHGTLFQGIFARSAPQIIKNPPGSAPALSKLPGQQAKKSGNFNAYGTAFQGINPPFTPGIIRNSPGFAAALAKTPRGQDANVLPRQEPILQSLDNSRVERKINFDQGKHSERINVISHDDFIYPEDEYMLDGFDSEYHAFIGDGQPYRSAQAGQDIQYEPNLATENLPLYQDEEVMANFSDQNLFVDTGTPESEEFEESDYSEAVNIANIYTQASGKKYLFLHPDEQEMMESQSEA